MLLNPQKAGLFWTRAKLAQWGRWAKAEGIGYPSIAAHEAMRCGSVFSVGRDVPEHLEAIELAVLRAPVDFKMVLVEHYTKKGSIREHAARLGWAKSTYFTRKDSAEEYVCALLT